MLTIFRTFTLALLGVFLSVLGTFAGSAGHVAAPTQNVPAKIEPEETQPTPVVETADEPAPIVSKKEPAALPEKPALQTEEAPAMSPAELNERVRSAVVNIICLVKSGSSLNSISASGVIIDPSGVIITNSHVAQYFLLRNYEGPGAIDCSIRTGSPAQPAYMAELLFLPPSWIHVNAEKIDDADPMGNGEHDYALLRVTGTANANVSVPASFPFLSLAPEDPVSGNSVLIAGYPAGFLGGITISKDLYQASSVTTVHELYTFATNTLDLFSIGGSIVAQRGSSGGAVATTRGTLMGLIVTSTDAPDTGSRDLRAIAAPYILRDFENESGTSLSVFLASDLREKAREFAENTAPSLRQELENALAH